MFERYTEKARRVIFFARYEASQFGSPLIETEHLLPGLLREDKALANLFPRLGGPIESAGLIDSIRAQVEKRTKIGDKVSTSVDLPLSQEGKRVLAYAAEEAERLNHKHIGTEHLLLGLLREDKCLAAEILYERGLRLSTVREELTQAPSEKPAPRKEPTLLAEFSRDLTQAAVERETDPLIGRENELDRVMHILSLRSRNNPVLTGEPGVGKAALVKGLAQRIVEGTAPSFFAEKRILALDPSTLVAGARHTGKFEERLKIIVQEVTEAGNVILFIEELFAPGSSGGSLDAINILRPALTRREIQCIAAAAPGDYEKSMEMEPWLDQCFQVVKVPPPDHADAIKIMFGIKDRYEKFHGVTYSEEALKCAVDYSERYLPGRQLPDKAIDLIDEAGAMVKLRQPTLPPEFVEVKKRLKFAIRDMEIAIANHEFEKARSYSDEERKERENLRQLREKHKVDEAVKSTVTRQDVEEVVAHMTGVPLTTIRQEGPAGEPGIPGPGGK
jgi:ATP-dependent Clp protease ATP-binding subunit ClpC